MYDIYIYIYVYLVPSGGIKVLRARPVSGSESVASTELSAEVKTLKSQITT